MRKILKRLSASLVVLTLGAAAAGCGGAAGGQDDGDGPIRIGLSTYLTGNFAAAGIPMRDGAEAWAAMVNDAGGIDGRQVEIVTKDDAGEQAKALQNLREFASDGIHLVVPNGTSSICAAMGPVAQQLGTVVVGGCKDPSLLPPDGPKNYYMADLSQDSFAKAAGVLAADRFSDIKTWDVYTMDYLTGKTTAEQVTEEIQKQQPGAKVDQTVFTPMAATDQRSYISSLQSRATGDKRGLYVYLFGSLAPNFVKQATAAGLFDRYDVVLFQSLTDQILDAVGADLPEVWGISDFIPQSYEDVAEHEALRKAYEAKFPDQEYPWGHFAATNALSAFKAAVEKAGSTDPQEVRKALDDGLSFTNHKGEVTVANHYLASSVAMAKCQGDSASSRGWTCDLADTIPAADVTAPEFLPGG